MLILLYLKKEKVENMTNGNNSRLAESFLHEDDIRKTSDLPESCMKIVAETASIYILTGSFTSTNL